MTFTVNKVILAGRISDYGVKLSYLPSGKPELTFQLLLEKPGPDGKTFKTYVPVQVYGGQSEPLAETLEPGDWVLIDGSLGYRRHASDQGKGQASLAVTCFTVDVLSRAVASLP